MSISDFSDDELLERCIDCAEDIPSFCSSFLYSLKDALDEYGELTTYQREALENIAIKWHMF